VPSPYFPFLRAGRLLLAGVLVVVPRFVALPSIRSPRFQSCRAWLMSDPPRDVVTPNRSAIASNTGSPFSLANRYVLTSSCLRSGVHRGGRPGFRAVRGGMSTHSTHVLPETPARMYLFAAAIASPNATARSDTAFREAFAVPLPRLRRLRRCHRPRGAPFRRNARRHDPAVVVMDADVKMQQIVADITERARASELAGHPRILDLFGQEIARAGVVGEDRLAKQLGFRAFGRRRGPSRNPILAPSQRRRRGLTMRRPGTDPGPG
jgi:hypothetical protein